MNDKTEELQDIIDAERMPDEVVLAMARSIINTARLINLTPRQAISVVQMALTMLIVDHARSRQIAENITEGCFETLMASIANKAEDEGDDWSDTPDKDKGH